MRHLEKSLSWPIAGILKDQGKSCMVCHQSVGSQRPALSLSHPFTFSASFPPLSLSPHCVFFFFPAQFFVLLLSKNQPYTFEGDNIPAQLAQVQCCSFPPRVRLNTDMFRVQGPSTWRQIQYALKERRRGREWETVNEEKRARNGWNGCSIVMGALFSKLHCKVAKTHHRVRSTLPCCALTLQWKCKGLSTSMKDLHPSTCAPFVCPFPVSAF